MLFVLGVLFWTEGSCCVHESDVCVGFQFRGGQGLAAGKCRFMVFVSAG